MRSPSSPWGCAPARWAICLLALVAVLGTAFAAKQRGLLEKNQYAFSAAIRWGDFEGAWSMVDPTIRRERPMSAEDFARLEAFQITGYRDLASMPGPDGRELREIQIDFVRRDTLVQRRVRFTEVWRYDDSAHTWWIEALPDLLKER